MDKIKRVLTKKCSSPLTPTITVPVTPVTPPVFVMKPMSIFLIFGNSKQSEL